MRICLQWQRCIVSDQSRGIAKIDYDANNNPRRIQFVDGNITKYVYSASGQKLRTIHYTADSHVAKVAYGQTHELTNAEILCADSTDYLLDGSLILRMVVSVDIFLAEDTVILSHPHPEETEGLIVR